MTLNEIKIAIRNGNFTNEDLITLGSYIQNVKTEQAKATISVGDEVFVVQKTKKTKGIVEKINIDFVHSFLAKQRIYRPTKNRGDKQKNEDR